MPAKNTLTADNPVQQARRESEAHIAGAAAATRKRRDWAYVRLDTLNAVDTPFESETHTLEQRARLFFAGDYENLRGAYRRKCVSINVTLPGTLEEDVLIFKERTAVRFGKNVLDVEMVAVWVAWITTLGGEPTHEPDF